MSGQFIKLKSENENGGNTRVSGRREDAKWRMN